MDYLQLPKTRKQAKEGKSPQYYTGKPCKHGHICPRQTSNGTCVSCQSITRDKYYLTPKGKQGLKEYVSRPDVKEKRKNAARNKRRDNPELAREAARKYRITHSDKIKSYQSQYSKLNREALNAKRKIWAEDNPEKIKAYQLKSASLRKELAKAWRTRNPLNIFTRRTLDRLENVSSPDKYEERLGYTQKEFIAHIEKQFEEGMSWDNRSTFHIDHIKPINAFLKEGITDVAIINALSNLRPMWARDNLSKGAAYGV